MQQIYQLNKSIVSVEGQGQAPNDLLDQRDAAMAKLSELVNFDTQNRTDGSVILMIGGRPLVNGADGYSTLTTMTSASINTTTAPITINVKDSKLESVGIATSGGTDPVQLSNAVFTGGKIAGILDSRDNIVHSYKSQLDSIANTLITAVNAVYDATKTGGNTNNQDFFSGTTAADISINRSITSGSDINYTMYTPGDIAQILGNLNDKLVSTRVISEPLTLSSNSPLSAVPLAAGTSGYLLINNVQVPVTSTMTVADLVNSINTHSDLFSAVYNDVTKTFFMVSDAPLEISEVNLGGQFLRNMKLIEEQISTSPIVYQGSLASQNLNLNASWANQSYIFDNAASLNGTLNVYMENQKYQIAWANASPILSTTWSIFALDGNSATPPGISEYNYFPDQKFHFGTRVGNGGVAGTISPFIMGDQSGNLTQTMKMVGNMTFDQYYKSVLGQLSGDMNSSSSMLSSYKSALDQLTTMQANITKVDVNAEQAKAAMYQRAYDASVQLSTVINEMLDMLINHTGSSVSTTTTA